MASRKLAKLARPWKTHRRKRFLSPALPSPCFVCFCFRLLLCLKKRAQQFSLVAVRTALEDMAYLKDLEKSRTLSISSPSSLCVFFSFASAIICTFAVCQSFCFSAGRLYVEKKYFLCGCKGFVFCAYANWGRLLRRCPLWRFRFLCPLSQR